jgi:RHS repeat-associated protein
LNQYTQRTVPPYVDVQGSAHSNATVTVNTQSTYRKAEYFRAELSADNSGGPLWFGVTNVAVLTNGSGPDIVTTNEGNVLVAKATETFLHDLDGNLTSDSLWTNTWNGENRLVATESRADVPSAGRAKETWTHLSDGRWIERVVANWNGSAYTNAYTNRFVWDGQVLLGILDHTNGLISSFVRGLDLSGSIQGAGGVGGVLAMNIATNGVHFTVFDGNGNVSALVSAINGAVTANYEYSPFGETLRGNGVVARANPIRFSTQFTDDLTGDLRYLFREARPSSGRWLSRDPMEERGGANLFRFANNNPITFVDSLGMWVTLGPVDKDANTIVCDGKGGIRVQLERNAHNSLGGILECIIRHEMAHIEDALKASPNVCKPNVADGTQVNAEEHEYWPSELRGYEVEKACLLRKKCKEPNYAAQYDARLKVVEDQISTARSNINNKKN